jgi:hypothetical protein
MESYGMMSPAGKPRSLGRVVIIEGELMEFFGWGDGLWWCGGFWSWDLKF